MKGVPRQGTRVGRNDMRNGLRYRFLTLVAISLISITAAGCSKRFSDLPAFSPIPLGDSYNYSVGRFKTSYLADQIHAYYRGHISGPIGVATFVDVDNLYSASTFGRILSEQIMTELAMRGYSVIELRKSDAIQIMALQGEFGLSRDISRLRGHQDLAGLVVGTYAASPERVYVNARIIDPTSAAIVSAGSVEMAKDDEIDRLLRSNSIAPSMERIPVRNLGYASFPVPYYYPGPVRFGSPNGEDEEGGSRNAAPAARMLDVPEPTLPKVNPEGGATTGGAAGSGANVIPPAPSADQTS